MRILYLDLDALNPSHLSCYGYPRQTSPTIDAIAREGLRCTGVYTSDAPCLPSRTAFYQGRFGIQTGVVGHGGTAADPKRQGVSRDFRSTYEEDSLPRQLQKAGFHTAMISPFGQRHAAHQFYAGYHEIHNTGKGGSEAVADVQPTIEDWLDRKAGGDQWYLHINYWDIHTNYRTPMDYGDPFADQPVPDWMLQAWKRHADKTGPHSPKDLGMYGDAPSERCPRMPVQITSDDDLRQWINGYDTAIRYVDDQIAIIVEKLKAAGVYEDTAIVISADHGENQGQLGIYGEHGTADHATCNIPFVLKWPGGVTGQVDHALHYHLDWAPTLMDLLGRRETCPSIWDGQAFTQTVMQADAAPQGRDDLVVSQACHVCQRSVVWDELAEAGNTRWLYMRTYHDGFHGFPQEMLFNLTQDPQEQFDVAEDEARRCREGAWRLMRWHDAQMHKMARTQSTDVTDALWTVMHEDGPFHANTQRGSLKDLGGIRTYLKRLEDTGRPDGAEMIRGRHAEALATLGSD